MAENILISSQKLENMIQRIFDELHVFREDSSISRIR